MSSPIVGPVPPYSNPPIEPQFYIPQKFNIADISFGVTTLVTTSVNHDYVIAQLVRMLIPSKFGSIQLNEKTAYVIEIPAPNQVILELDSNGTTPFIPTPTFVMFQSQTPAQIVAVGDINMGAINSHGRVNQGTFIPGSFINIS